MVSSCEACDGILVPFETEARPLCGDCPIDGAIWFGENSAGDIEMLEPMNGRRDRKQMGASLHKNMA